MDTITLKTKTSDPHVVNNYLAKLISEKADPADPDEKLEPQELKDFFMPHFDTNGDSKVDLKDSSLPLIYRLSKVSIEIDKTQKDNPVAIRFLRHVEVAKRFAQNAFIDANWHSTFRSLGTEPVTKDEVRAMIQYLSNEAEREYTADKTNEHKKKTYESIKRYLECFDKIKKEKDLWLEGNDLTAAAACVRTKTGEFYVFPRLHREIATNFRNMFNDPAMRKIFTTLIVKESEHLLLSKDNYDAINDITLSFLDSVNKYKGIKKPQEIKPDDDLQERAKWIVGTHTYDEYVGYKGMFEWLKKEEIDSKKLDRWATKYEGIDGLEETCTDLSNRLKNEMGRDGTLDFNTFAINWFTEKIQGLLTGRQKLTLNDKDSTFKSSLFIILRGYVLKNLPGGGEVSISKVGEFLTSRNYTDPHKFPRRLKTR